MRYHRIMIAIYAVIVAINAIGANQLFGRNSAAPFNALFAVWFSLLIVGRITEMRAINRMDYYARLMGIAHRRNVWAKEIARLEQNIYGETYDHDRNYLPGQEKRS